MLIGQPQSEVIGLGARVDHVDHREGRGEGVGDPLGVEDEVVMEEPRVGVQDFHLLLASLHHVRVTVTNMGHVIDAIKILNMTQLLGGYNEDFILPPHRSRRRDTGPCP